MSRIFAALMAFAFSVGLFGISEIHANCSYDAVGNTQVSPSIVIGPDGKVTYGAENWWEDDVIACYQAFLNPVYLDYFGGCDRDGSGLVEAQEILDVYYFVLNYPSIHDGEAYKWVCTDLPDPIESFKSSDPQVADAAYEQLFAAGLQYWNEIITMALIGYDEQFAGVAWRDHNSSMFPTSRTVSEIALFLLEAIRSGEMAPHSYPILMKNESTLQIADDDIVLFGAAQYHLLVANNPGITLQELQQLPDPMGALEGLFWAQNAPSIAMMSMAPQSGGNGVMVPGSATPVLTAHECHSGQDCFFDAVPYPLTGPTPYNCAAHAFGIDDHWVQPPQGAQPPHYDIMTELSGDLGATQINCDHIQECLDLLPQDEHYAIIHYFNSGGVWEHSMPVHPDGTASSKNGEGPLYEGITDPDAFAAAVPYATDEKLCFCRDVPIP